MNPSIFTVKKYQPTHKNLWDDFVTKAKNATFLFRRDFMDYHQDRFDDYSLLVFKKKKLVAVLPANILKTHVHSHQGLTYGGLVTSRGLRFEDTLESFKAVLQFLDQQNIDTLALKGLPAMYCKTPSDELQYLMFLVEANLIRRDALSVVDLRANIKFSDSRTEGCKRAEKHGLVIKEVDEFDEFWNHILIPNLQEKHQTKPVHSLEEISLLKQKFPKQIRQFNVYDNTTIVAGTTIFETETLAHAQYISGNSNKNTNGSLDVLYAHLIHSVFKDKTYLDFGMSNENSGQQVNTGLMFWKEGFGARTITQDFYKVATKNYTKLNHVML